MAEPPPAEEEAPAAGAGAPARQAAAAADEELECTICFEELSSVGGAIPLPCDCKVTYCSACWDRALAASMSVTGRGSCPSCRSAMRVSFDPDTGRLSFSRAVPDESQDNWRKRLYEEAKPLQIRLLREYGGQDAVPAGVAEAMEGCGGGASGSGARAASEGAGAGEDPKEAPTFAPAPAEDGMQPPRCVCGSRLARTSVRDRVFAFISEETPISPPPSAVEQLMRAPPIICDICRRQLDPCGSVWTCENGRRTVLHAVAYDVCEYCFALHAHGVEIPADSGRGGAFSDSYSGSSNASEEDDGWG